MRISTILVGRLPCHRFLAACAADLVVFGGSAPIRPTVPADWILEPFAVDAAGKFRLLLVTFLLLVTSMTRDAESAATGDYDTHIQNTVAAVGPFTEVPVLTLILPTAPIMVDEGSTGIFEVEFESAPSETVTVSVESGDTGAVAVSPQSLTFTTENWNVAQTVTVTGVQDDDAINETVELKLSGAGVTTGTVVVHVEDDDLGFPCDESLGLGRVARDDRACAILDTIIVTVNGDMDKAAEELENRPGWTVLKRMSIVPVIVAQYFPDVLTLADLKAEMAAIASMPWASSVEYDAVVTGTTPEAPNTVTASEPQGAELPAQVALGQNYPNPFNPVTSFEYALDRTMHVTLRVYDAFGHEVATLADGVRQAGNYRVRFDGSGLASGMYLYRLETPNRMLARRMILLK